MSQSITFIRLRERGGDPRANAGGGARDEFDQPPSHPSFSLFRNRQRSRPRCFARFAAERSDNLAAHRATHPRRLTNPSRPNEPVDAVAIAGVQKPAQTATSDGVRVAAASPLKPERDVGKGAAASRLRNWLWIRFSTAGLIFYGPS
jgi:hypothetical protein